MRSKTSSFLLLTLAVIVAPIAASAQGTAADYDRALQFAADGATWRCTLAEYTCRKPPPGEPGVAEAGRGRGQGAGGQGAFFGRGAAPDPERGLKSPDGKVEAVIWNYNVAVRDATSKKQAVLTTDGSEGEPYTFASLVWSPDSRKIAASRVRPGYKREVHYV